MAKQGFNSIVVRLKATTAMTRCRKRGMFQFHSGSIKSVARAKKLGGKWMGFNSIVVRLKVMLQIEHNVSQTEFQFHSGSIKRLKQANDKADRQGFNSIVVRLKVGYALIK